jgi:tRNA(fMet)-specific endonuclease VapC
VPQYLLDTNHLSPLVTPEHPLRNRVLVLMQQGSTFSIPVPALTELLYGIQLLPRSSANLAEWQRLRTAFIYYQVEQVDAEAAADLQITLRRRGRQLATVDALIAVIALRYNLTLLTTDGDFEEIKQMKRENWLIRG